MELFKGRNLLEFAEQFKTDKNCKGFFECRCSYDYLVGELICTIRFFLAFTEGNVR
ncbi:MAG: hypothetical protein ACJA1A_003660 [Saprospiraceae bacterium]|jgi:hypothetical protein